MDARELLRHCFSWETAPGIAAHEEGPPAETSETSGRSDAPAGAYALGRSHGPGGAHALGRSDAPDGPERAGLSIAGA